MAQQTAVEWLVEELKSKGHALVTNKGVFINVPDELFEKAKEMERNQIVYAMMRTFNKENTLPYGMEYLSSLDEMINRCENYLKETYGTHE
jgi:hypothetical protein